LRRAELRLDRSRHGCSRSLTPELQEAMDDAPAYASARYPIEQAFEAKDGAITIQGVQTCTINGLWRSMEATGQQVSFPFCSIFRFDDDGLIVHEEQYYDMFRAATTRLLTSLVTRNRACLIPSYPLIRVLDQPRRSSADRWVSKSPVKQPLPT